MDMIAEHIAERTYLDFKIEKTENGDLIIRFVNEDQSDQRTI